jgi:cystathionine beta-synthase
LAIAAAVKGYKCIFVLPDKMSEEKIRNLRAFGARVVVTPTAVEAADPRSYYSVSRRLAAETPNAIYIDQYNNLANREAHYQQTGPEILSQMPDMDYFIAGIGTGGTLCGAGRYFKEHNPKIKVVAVDPVGSIVYEYFKTGYIGNAPKTYLIEGIGEDFIPANYDFTYVDDMVQVADRESFLMTRDLLLKEGIFAGISSGSAVVGALRWLQNQGDAVRGKKAVIILCDTGSRYLSKVYDDDWMREVGFLDDTSLGQVADMISLLDLKPPITLLAHQKISAAVDLMKDKGISQIPILDKQGLLRGIATETKLFKGLFGGQFKLTDTIDTASDPLFTIVRPEDSVEHINRILAKGKTPLVMNNDQLIAIITRIDVITYLERRRF